MVQNYLPKNWLTSFENPSLESESADKKFLAFLLEPFGLCFCCDWVSSVISSEFETFSVGKESVRYGGPEKKINYDKLGYW